MIFHPKYCEKKTGQFVLSEQICATAHSCLDQDVLREFWSNFTFQSSEISFCATSEYVFSVGNAEKLPLDGYSYTINVKEDGICLFAEDRGALVKGFMTLLDLMKPIDRGEETGAALACCQIKDRPSVAERMVHFCIFPETELWEIRRFIRFCGALKYTHVVLEFWGMLRYDCMRELAWESAFSKEEIRPIIREANALGLEVVPMFNHWGHASAGRVMHGKHVVLDQNPRLQSYFSEDGWCWDIRKEKVKRLLREIRKELSELCGEGKYFHIGCDEAYHFGFSDEQMAEICDFINGIGAELASENRRVMIWGDMFLYRHAHYHPKNHYTCNAPSPDAEKEMLRRLDRRIVIADWQYNAPIAPVETCEVFKKAGFDCFLCPWDVGEAQMKSAISTVKSQALDGFLHTTWHTLSSGMPFVLLAAVCGFDRECEWDLVGARTYTAALLRRVMPVGGDYRKAGWSKVQISCKW